MAQQALDTWMFHCGDAFLASGGKLCDRVLLPATTTTSTLKERLCKAVGREPKSVHLFLLPGKRQGPHQVPLPGGPEWPAPYVQVPDGTGNVVSISALLKVLTEQQFTVVITPLVPQANETCLRNLPIPAPAAGQEPMFPFLVSLDGPMAKRFAGDWYNPMSPSAKTWVAMVKAAPSNTKASWCAFGTEADKAALSKRLEKRGIKHTVRRLARKIPSYVSVDDEAKDTPGTVDVLELLQGGSLPDGVDVGRLAGMAAALAETEERAAEALENARRCSGLVRDALRKMGWLVQKIPEADDEKAAAAALTGLGGPAQKKQRVVK